MAKTITYLAPGGGTNPIPLGKVPGDRKRIRFNFAADNSYPTGGYAIAPTDIGFAAQIDYVDIVNENVSAWTAVWNRATQKMQLCAFATGAEVANATDTHTFNADCVAEGL